ncbi:NUDIX domain-containing protein [Candidatus Uhrbacteria bacterium]|nr:NUDIX domain-containing protein [Candidatus Uhrbacteria bacterium]
MGEQKEITVAIALVFFGDKLLLIRRRHANPIWDKKWEFPGGKVENGEDPMSTARRELMEETGIEAKGQKFLGVHPHDWEMPDGSTLRIHLHCYQCRTENNAVSLEEGKADQYAWADPDALQGYDLLGAIPEIIQRFVVGVRPRV